MLDVVSGKEPLHHLEGRRRAGGLPGAGGCHLRVADTRGNAGRGVDQLRRNISQEPRWEVESGTSPEVTAEGVEQVEPVLGPGHADVRQPPLLLQALR